MSIGSILYVQYKCALQTVTFRKGFILFSFTLVTLYFTISYLFNNRD